MQSTQRLRVTASLATSCALLLSPTSSPAQEALLGIASPAPAGFVTSIKPYMVSVSAEYAVQPLLSVGDRVPRTSDPSQQYQMVGIPDGMGAYRDGDKTIVYMNHELVQAAVSEPIIGQPLNRGTFVSRFVLARDGSVLSGDRAYDDVYNGDTFVGPAPDVTNSTPAFSRFCSGSLSYREAGFDRPIYLAGEESSGAATFDGLGGLGIVVFEHRGKAELHTMPKFGRFPWENALAQPRRRKLTVLMGMEDGPNTPDNQLYMWVGEKDFSRNASPMRKNGLLDGKLYVFVSTTTEVNTEPAFFALGEGGTIQGEWVEITSADTLTDLQLEAASDAAQAFGFVRIEDGAFNPRDPDEFFFVTTGSGPDNPLGAVYRMRLDEHDPAGETTIELVLNANAVVAAGGDTALSPDNIGMDRNTILINEDGTANSRPLMASKGRSGSVWRLDKRTYETDQIADLFPPARDANFAIASGVWETTGVIPIEGFGPEAWLINVQAHAPTVAPAPNTVEDGQLLMLRRTGIRALK
jgi:secreted PhoX family phosphatase